MIQDKPNTIFQEHVFYADKIFVFITAASEIPLYGIYIAFGSKFMNLSYTHTETVNCVSEIPRTRCYSCISIVWSQYFNDAKKEIVSRMIEKCIFKLKFFTKMIF